MGEAPAKWLPGKTEKRSEKLMGGSYFHPYRLGTAAKRVKACKSNISLFNHKQQLYQFSYWGQGMDGTASVYVDIKLGDYNLLPVQLSREKVAP
ncbi:MAG: hypothetical protein GX589_09815 [Deltaproteobacteria bacterium]|nr:hypothetical protein [Deltaproteobacteria bacterium]